MDVRPLLVAPPILPPTPATFSELRRQTATKRMSQTPEIQDSATLRELD
jgi:hypothetical protein